MTKDQEVNKWYAEQMGLDGDTEWLFDINDPACQMEIIEWCTTADKYQDGGWGLSKEVRGDFFNAYGDDIKKALIALYEVMKDA